MITKERLADLMQAGKEVESDMRKTLNDRLNKKNLGAFYTPIPYCNKAVELVKKSS